MSVPDSLRMYGQNCSLKKASHHPFMVFQDACTFLAVLSSAIVAAFGRHQRRFVIRPNVLL